MVNIHDKAHELAKALKETDEVKAFKQLRNQVDGNPQLKSMIEDFNRKQLESQKYVLEGKQIPASEMNKLQELYDVIARDPIARQFLEVQMKVATLVNDVTKIITQAIE